jgi:hypothetical protein
MISPVVTDCKIRYWGVKREARHVKKDEKEAFTVYVSLDRRRNLAVIRRDTIAKIIVSTDSGQHRSTQAKEHHHQKTKNEDEDSRCPSKTHQRDEMMRETIIDALSS